MSLIVLPTLRCGTGFSRGERVHSTWAQGPASALISRHGGRESRGNPEWIGLAPAPRSPAVRQIAALIYLNNGVTMDLI
jgi:hypothetical protein